MQDFGEGGGGGVRHEKLMKRMGARGAREKFCGAHSKFSTDCTCKGAGD